MPTAVPSPTEMFSDATTATEVATRFEDYKATLAKSHTGAEHDIFDPSTKTIVKGARAANATAEHIANITKSVPSEVLASIQGELDALKAVEADLAKDWTLTNPNATGLVPYDLEAPAKLLVPRLTPLRNVIPREKGQGTARQFKRITGWSNSGVGGVADQSAFMNSDTVQTSFGSLALRRGAKIAYASDNKSVIYKEQSLSDQVNWSAQFAGQGFQDIRSLSQTALLWATFGAEERSLLYGRGTDTGFVGAVSAPVISSSTATTGGTIAAGTYAIVVTAKTGFGETAVSNNPSQVTTGATSTITVNVTTEPAGSLGVYNLYVSQAGGAVGTATFQTQFVGNTITITAPPSNTGAVNPGATNTSASAAAYDGFLTVQADPNQTGYFKRLNAALSTVNPGAEFQAAFLSLYQSVKADPDDVLCDASVMKEVGDLLKTASSANYRLNLNGDGHGHFLGTSITGIENQVTKKMVNLDVHPYMPQGNALIRSRTLPVPDSEVNATAAVIGPQDYMAVDWPVVQFTYDQSTYMYNALVHYAPGWSGLISNIL
ncbi:hypothetical protein [Amycolatopsis vancoresmycina]|uniref:Uncharacterized protein n=1 Tax=Amycolatopsis vancoresmycina DSM 44592 TaxID=1292037 RepID=R1I914_9PSEU|nr:hypothetical protein [Amycolatopsis vancoresmycina]EOD66899.1 hypothetical protein H480_19288 [Amycolatopsis vancoresmycina DSM 44592]